MRRFHYLTVALLLSCSSLSGQDSTRFFFDQFHVSINRTNVADDNTSNKTGFGLGAAHVFFNHSKLNFVMGLEFNQTSQHNKYGQGSRFSSTTDVTYKLNTLSLPIAGRFNIGHRIRVFTEIGWYFEMLISASQAGIGHSWVPYQEPRTYTFKGKANFTDKWDFGPSLSLGLFLPIMQIDTLFRLRYKHGLKGYKSNTKYSQIVYNSYYDLSVGIHF